MVKKIQFALWAHGIFLINQRLCIVYPLLNATKDRNQQLIRCYGVNFGGISFCSVTFIPQVNLRQNKNYGLKIDNCYQLKGRRYQGNSLGIWMVATTCGKRYSIRVIQCFFLSVQVYLIHFNTDLLLFL